MERNWENVSGQELAWTIPAVLALGATILMIRWVYRAFSALQASIVLSPLRYRRGGPRWNFLLLLLGVLVCFGVGWLGFIAIGLLAMMTPPPVREINQEASFWFAWMLIGMEMLHALALGLLWVALRSLAGASIIPRPGIPWKPLRLRRTRSS